MSKKYKFILTLPYDIEVDSAEEIEGYMAWPNWSQADPVSYKGIFDSYDEAKKYASEFEIYKYILKHQDYDSYEDEGDYPKYYLSIFGAEDAARAEFENEPIRPDNYIVEEIDDESYKYCFYYEDECVYDSLNDGMHFDTYEDAGEAAAAYMGDFEVDPEDAYELVPVEIVDISIEEIND